MIKASTFLFVLLLISGAAIQSCKKKNGAPITKTELKVPKIEQVLSGSDQSLIALLNKVRGSVGRRGPASKTIWSRKGDYGLGLYISANHVYGLSGWTSRNAQ